MFSQVYTQETTFGTWKYDYCRLKLMAQRHLEQKMKDCHVKARNRDEERLAIGALSKRKSKRKRQNTMPKTTRERRLHPLDDKKTKPMTTLEKHAHSSMTRTRRQRDDPGPPSPTGSQHRNVECDGKGGDESRQVHQTESRENTFLRFL